MKIGHHVYKDMWTPACGEVLEDIETSRRFFFWKFWTASKIALKIEYALLSEMRLFVEVYMVYSD